MLARLSTDSGRSFQGLSPKDPDMVGTLVAADGKLSGKLISVQETAEVGLMTCVLGRVSHSARHHTPASRGARVISTATERGRSRRGLTSMASR